jgi:hypothetical protein
MRDKRETGGSHGKFFRKLVLKHIDSNANRGNGTASLNQDPSDLSRIDHDIIRPLDSDRRSERTLTRLCCSNCGRECQAFTWLRIDDEGHSNAGLRCVRP